MVITNYSRHLVLGLETNDWGSVGLLVSTTQSEELSLRGRGPLR